MVIDGSGQPYMRVTLVHKIEWVEDPGCNSGAGFVPFPCQKGGTGVEVQLLVQSTPLILFPGRLRVTTSRHSKKRGLQTCL
jgi:hypothetical protein